MTTITRVCLVALLLGLLLLDSCQGGWQHLFNLRNPFWGQPRHKQHKHRGRHNRNSQNKRHHQQMAHQEQIMAAPTFLTPQKQNLMLLPGRLLQQQGNELVPALSLPPGLQKQRQMQKELSNYKQHIMVNNIQKLKPLPMKKAYEQQLAASILKTKAANIVDRNKFAEYFGLPPRKTETKKSPKLKRAPLYLRDDQRPEQQVTYAQNLDYLHQEPENDLGGWTPIEQQEDQQRHIPQQVPYQPQPQPQQAASQRAAPPAAAAAPAPASPQQPAPQGRDYGTAGGGGGAGGDDRVRVKVYRGPTENGHAPWGFWVKQPPEAPAAPAHPAGGGGHGGGGGGGYGGPLY